MGLSVHFLGTRGPHPVAGDSIYGSDTSCVLLRVNEDNLIIDAGTGLKHVTSLLGSGKIGIFISHPHYDHIMGILAFETLFDVERDITIYGGVHSGLGVREYLNRFMSPPYWPVGIEVFHSAPKFNTVDFGDDIDFCGVHIQTVKSTHPGLALNYRFNYEGRSVVYASDFEHGDEQTASLLKFAKDADMLICDASYNDDEYARHKGWGHSCYSEAAKIGAAANVKEVYMYHHASFKSDAILGQEESGFVVNHKYCHWAKKGEVIEL